MSQANIATASRLIKKKGQLGAVIVQGASGSASNPTLTRTEHPAYFVTVPVSQGKINGTDVLMSDVSFILSVEGLDFAVDQTMLLKNARGDELEIITIMPLEPAGLTIMYEGIARA